jgi:hypothetical protein
MTITQVFDHAHQHCDALLDRLIQVQSAGDWECAQDLYWQFRHAMETHFAAEEYGLFPAFELSTGIRVGPTSVLRGDHDAMRMLLDHLSGAIAVHDCEGSKHELAKLAALMHAHEMREAHVLSEINLHPPHGLPEALLAQACAELAA